jgi:hypothetical protein
MLQSFKFMTLGGLTLEAVLEGDVLKRTGTGRCPGVLDLQCFRLITLEN